MSICIVVLAYNSMAETIQIRRKISRIRAIRGIKQDYLAVEMGVKGFRRYAPGHQEH